MKIYLAGPCDTDHRTMMQKIAVKLRSTGYDVYCPFEIHIENAWDYTQETWGNMVFEKDIEAIRNCDVFFMISCGRIGSAGTNFEEGFAYALNKRIIVLQYGENITTRLMTYSAATQFICCSNEYDMFNGASLNHAIQAIENDYEKKRCSTTLT
ncbi:MAG: nucleoside 2-deoxyribosyltransferase [Clostridia bacterium]|nr:nucleoside 2-deoxyribosyltransferase [Clostridia bacterium]